MSCPDRRRASLWTAGFLVTATGMAAVAYGVADPRPGVISAATGLSGGLLLIGLTSLVWYDVHAFRLPNTITYSLLAAGLALAAAGLAGPSLAMSVAGAVVGYGTIWCLAYAFSRLRGKQGIGMGDAKLMAVSGAWLGVLALPTIFLVSSLVGLIVALVCSRFPAILGAKDTDGQLAIPFGIPISVSIWAVWLWQSATGGIL